MTSIGERLREERLRRGLDLQIIAEQTKIGYTFLQAIESDDLSRLPGSFFARSFIRQYARALGLDQSELEPELTQLASAETAEPEEQRPPRFMPPPMPGPARGKPHSLAALLAFLAVTAGLAGTYAVWQKMRDDRGQEPAPVSQRSPAVTRASFSPAPSTQAPAAVQPPAPAATTPAETTPQPAAPVEPPATPAPAAQQQTTSAVRVELRSTATTWIRVTADGKFLFIGNLDPGDSKIFEGQQSVNIRTGNAGGLEAVWNGKPAVSLGAAGQVRTVEFTREAIRFVEASLPKPPSAGL